MKTCIKCCSSATYNIGSPFLFIGLLLFGLRLRSFFKSGCLKGFHPKGKLTFLKGQQQLICQIPGMLRSYHSLHLMEDCRTNTGQLVRSIAGVYPLQHTCIRFRSDTYLGLMRVGFIEKGMLILSHATESF